MIFASILLCFLAITIVHSAPLKEEQKPSEVTVYQFLPRSDGGYFFKYGTSDGQKREEYGDIKKLGDQNILVITGKYSHIDGDGKIYQVRYSSDEKGYRASGDHLPKTGTEFGDNLGDKLGPAVIATLVGRG